MASWIEQAIARGILTTRYPRADPTEAEVPLTGRAPVPGVPPVPWAAAVDSCPVGAIAETSVDQGKCIRCARCLPYGLAFAGSVESVGRSRVALRAGGSDATRSAGSDPPLSGFARSVHVFLVDVGSCNACNLEVLALANPFYDSQRLGIFFTNSPRHADLLLVVGVPTLEMRDPLRRAYEAIPSPKAVVAVGACPVSGGAFAGSPGLVGPLDELLPVDVYLAGCPPSPLGILNAIRTAAGRGRSAEGE